MLVLVRDLWESERRLLDALRDARNDATPDVSVRRCFRALYERWPEDAMRPRTQQQRVGSSVARINRKIRGARIVPGVARRTYRLVTGE